MKILLIGGTGTISSAITDLLLKSSDVELYLLNRGNSTAKQGVNSIVCDINDVQTVKEKIKDLHFDAVADFIAFTTDHIKRDFEIFKDKCEQYIFISSASSYQKPLLNPVITEETPLENPFWQYSENKRMCEELLMDYYKTEGFPVTIVRPSHTYGDKSIPVAVHGKNGSFAVVKRMLEGKRVIVHGDGESFWTLTHNTDFASAFVGSEHINYHICGNEKERYSHGKLEPERAYESFCFHDIVIKL